MKYRPVESREDLIARVAKSLGITKKHAKQNVDVVLGCISEAIVESGGVKLRGIGTLTTYMIKGRDRSYFGTHTVSSEDSISVRLKPSSILVDKLRSN